MSYKANSLLCAKKIALVFQYGQYFETPDSLLMYLQFDLKKKIK